MVSLVIRQHPAAVLPKAQVDHALYDGVKGFSDMQIEIPLPADVCRTQHPLTQRRKEKLFHMGQRNQRRFLGRQHSAYHQ